jgi:hypothetical protein
MVDNIMKKFNETKFGGFVTKVVGKFPELAGDIITVATSPNPVGATLNLLREKITEKAELAESIDELEKFKMEWEKEMAELEVKDRISARETYQLKNEMADKIANRIVRWNIWIALALVAINILCTLFLDNIAIAVASNVIGILLGQVLRERGTVVDFFFGSSLGSKNKDDERLNSK